MAKKRKTADRRRQEQAVALDRAWERFSQKLERLRTWSDAVALAGAPPSKGNPEGRYYSNFKLFFDTYIVPMSASVDELILYAQFIERLDEKDFPGPANRGEVLEKLRAAIRAKNPE